MSEHPLRQIEAGSMSYRIAEAGSGPLVVLLHGFPESWYSWRHQVGYLASAGYHVVAPDMRGYGGTSKPDDIDAYDQVELAGDVATIIEALGESSAVVIGHDWGAPVAWNTASLHPERVRAVGALSVPYRPRGTSPPLPGLKKLYGDRFFYQLYFQTPGVAESEFEADVRGCLRKFIYLASGDSPPQPVMLQKVKGDQLCTDLIDPDPLPTWLSEEDLDYYVNEFSTNGFRGPLNWYRNLDRSWSRTEHLTGHKIQQPALFVAGEDDLVIKFWPNALEVMQENVNELRTLELLPTCGHWTQQERPDDTNKLLREFLDGL
ncbi:MAG: alpha/beta hydrolase [Pseudomonadota bacterium]